MMRIAMLGSGTDIGKTHISCALLKEARKGGLTVHAYKPVMSGFATDQLAESDAGRLAAACGHNLDAASLDRFCHYAFTEAVAPNVAARRSGVSMDYAALVNRARQAMARNGDLILLEGAGGVLSPVTDEKLNADLAADLGLSAVIVTANYLGTISHTLSAIESCRQRGVAVCAIAISQPTTDFEPPAEVIGEFGRWTRLPCIAFNHDTNDQISSGAGPLLAALEGIAE